jgi:hypothetical protein
MAAPDFYYGINATFRHIHDRYGEHELIRYWETMGREYFAPLTQRFRQGGSQAIAGYWREFFDEEPGAEVDIACEDDRVILDVRTCPAIKHLRAGGRDIMPLYCDHCTHVSRGFCDPAGYEVEVEGGMGSCRQTFTKKGAGS